VLHSRLSSIEDKLKAWWNHEDQKNPCIIVSALKDDHEPIPDTEDLKKHWTDVDFVINRQMKLIKNTNYYGQAVPYHYIDFGASAMHLVLGAEPNYINKETIWAHPFLDSLDEVLDVTLDMENFCYHTIKEIAKGSAAISNNHHLIAPYALGGTLDNLAGLYGTENTLVELISNPTKVKITLGHLKNLWIKAFYEIHDIIGRGNNRGCIGWAGIWAPGTTFPIQEDVSYMISPEMFREFCLPHIMDMMEAMEYSFYHLDGIGAIPHLDALLEIKSLKAIQWQPGAGKERLDQWYDLIKYILSKGKSVQLYANVEEIAPLIENVGTKGLLVVCIDATNAKAEQLMKLYDKE